MVGPRMSQDTSELSDLPFLVFIAGSLNLAANILHTRSDVISCNLHRNESYFWRTVKFTLRLVLISFLISHFDSMQEITLSCVSILVDRTEATTAHNDYTAADFNKEEFVIQVTEWIILFNTCTWLVASSTIAMLVDSILHCIYDIIIAVYNGVLNVPDLLYPMRDTNDQTSCVSEHRLNRKIRREL